MTLNEQAKYVHSLNERWWRDLQTGKPIQRNRGELLMLVITELAEAVEGIRKNLQDDKLPHRKMEEVEMADAKIRLLDYAGGFEIFLDEDTKALNTLSENKAEAILELSKYVIGIECEARSYGMKDAVLPAVAIRYVEKYCSKFGLDLEGAVREKLEYNRTREDHKPENRLKENGKKF